MYNLNALQQYYTTLHACLIQIPIGEKAATANWKNAPGQTLTKVLADGPSNVAIKLGDPSRRVVDVDLDDELARDLAPFFLPETGCIFGRESSPRSHWVYRIEGEPGQRRAFEAPRDSLPTKGMIVEYRANGCYTLVPPSVHPSGEEIRFYSEAAPAEAERDDLLACVRKLAAGALIARHWRNGARHSVALPLAGYLAWIGWPESEVSHFIGAICSVTQDEEPDKRLNDVKTTFARANRNDANSGLTTLKRVLGEGTADKLRQWLEPEGGSQATWAPSQALCEGHEGTDAFRAQQFADHVASHLRYVTEQERWIKWNGSNWNDVAEVEVLEKARLFAISQFEALRSAPPANFQTMMRALSAGAQRRGIEATVALSRGQLGLSIETLDADPLVIGCENGWVDLVTGQGHPANPEMFISKSVRAKFDPDARCNAFVAFLDRIFAGDAQLIAYLQRVAGYLLTGDTSEQAFFIAHGTGANGKSTLFNLLAYVLGDYSANVQASALSNTRADGGAATPELAGLCGKRFAQTMETKKRQRLDEALIKQLSGGERLTARFLNRNPFTFQPCFKLVMATNFKPDFSGGDAALFRRVHLIPFDVTIPERQRDPKLFDKLKAEADGILAWAVRGCSKWQDIGLAPPPKVVAATKAYREEMDDLQGFLDAMVSVGPDERLAKSALYEAYETWAKEEGADPIPKKAFGSELKHKGFREAPGRSSGRQWLGIGMRAQDHVVDAVTSNAI